jgi:hypothetical protein
MAISGYTAGSINARFTRKLSAYQYATGLRQIQANNARKFIEDGAIISNSLMTASSNFIQGTGTLTAQAAIDRLKAQTAAKKVNKTA